jgi:hypothetical protein
MASIDRAGLSLGVWHALAASLVLFAAVGARLSRPRAAAVASRRAFTEHVEATGLLYARARASAHALFVYARFAEDRLRKASPRGMTDVPTMLAQRTGQSLAECNDLYARVASPSPPARDDLDALRRFSALVARALGRG